MRINNQKLTKIVATLGPASASDQVVEDLIRAGVNVFRFNTKHGTPEWHEEHIRIVQKTADKIGVPIGILLDLQGPELRLETKNGDPVEVVGENTVTIHSSLEVPEAKIALPHSIVFGIIKVGDQVLIDDGYVEGKIVRVGEGEFDLQLDAPGIIKHRKGVNLPGKYIDLPSLIQTDLRQLDMASINKVDFVALSFARSAQDIKLLRDEMQRRGMQAQVVAKIESQPALDHLDELIQASDSVMVARGDLGIEVPIEELAFWQKEIIRRCRLNDKPVITATQMLESMINSPRPTRAEATDVANSVLDGTDAVMLSSETATGKYPVRAVEYMARIARFNESKSALSSLPLIRPADMTEQVTSAAVTMLRNQTDTKIDIVIIFTETGYTARSFASYRLNVPIIAVTDSQKTVETLTLSYGVTAYYTPFPEGELVDPDKILNKLRAQEVVPPGTTALVIHGKHWKTPGLTNSLTIVEV